MDCEWIVIATKKEKSQPHANNTVVEYTIFFLDVSCSFICKFVCAGEYAEVVVDYGGRVEDLVLNSRSSGKQWPVLLNHNGSAAAIEKNTWWKGMLLLPWANRIAYVRLL